MLTESQVVGTEMEHVVDKLPALFDRDSVFYAQIAKRPAEIVSARTARVPLEIRPGGNFGHFDPDGSDLGRGDGPSFDKATIDAIYLKHAIEWTTKSDWATDDKKKAIVSTFRHLLAKSMAEFRRNVDSLCMTAGNGVIGTISSVATAAGVDTYGLSTDGFGARLLRYGMTVNVYKSDLTVDRTPPTPAGAANDGAKIQFLDLPGKSIQVPAVTGAVIGDKLVSQGLSATPPVSLFGVPYHHSNASVGTWLGFDRSVTPEIRANNASGNNNAFTLPLARLAINKVGDRVGVDNVKKVKAFMHPAQKQAYEELAFQAIEINKSSKESGLDLYFNGNFSMAGAPIEESYSWDKTRIDFVDLEAWGRAVIKEPDFYKVDGRRIFEIRGASGGVATSQVFYIVAGFNLFVNNPAACAYIDALAVPAGY